MVQVTVEYREYDPLLGIANEQRYTLPMVPSDPLELLQQIDLVQNQENHQQVVILTEGLKEISFSSDAPLLSNDQQEYFYHQQKLYTRATSSDTCLYDKKAFSADGKGMERMSWWMNHFQVFAIPSSLVNSTDSKIRLEVKLLTGKIFPIDLPIYSTAAFLKELIRDHEGIPTDQQQLIYAGKDMKDQDRLLDHRVQNGSIVHVLLRLRGGMYLPPSARDGWDNLPICPASVPIKVTIECPYQPEGIFQLQLTLPYLMHPSDMMTEVSRAVAEYEELTRLGFGTEL